MSNQTVLRGVIHGNTIEVTGVALLGVPGGHHGSWNPRACEGWQSKKGSPKT